MDDDRHSHHDLSPARFFRRTPAPRPAARAPDPRGGRDGAATGGWVHLRAWMRMNRSLTGVPGASATP